MHQIFVYGTLKKDFPNHKTNKGKRLNGDYLTKGRYPFYIVGQRFTPWLMLDEGNGHHIRGQVFTINDATLADMDKLERITQLKGFRRIQMTVISEQSGQELLVFAYGKPLEQLQDTVIQTKLDNEYTVEHSLPYIGLKL